MTIRRLVVQIPGLWEDAWLYRDNLYVWDRLGAILSVPVDRLSGLIAMASDKHVQVLANQLILRSQRKSSRDFKEMTALQSVRRELFAPLQGQSELVVTLDASMLSPAPVERLPGNVTDTVVYGNRLFTATDSGTYETRLEPQQQARHQVPLLQVTDAPTTSVVAGAGQLAASLGERGLVAREVHFGEGEGWYEEAERATVKPLAPYSRSISSSSVHLLNYGEAPVPDFIKADRPRASRGSDSGERMVTKYEAPRPLTSTLTDAIGEGLSFGRDDVEVLGNASYRLLVRVRDEVEIVNIQAFDDRPLRLQKKDKLNLSQENARSLRNTISTQALSSGFLVEHLNGVHVFGTFGAVELADEMIVQARAFPNSRRYGDTVALIREDRLDLIGFVDVTP